MEQRIRFCTSSDGARIAYAEHGGGAPLVKVANWLTHLEHDWRSPVWRHWLDQLGTGCRFLRYDQRGCGLSDREPEGLSLELLVDDLEAVVDAAGLERFTLLGLSQGGPVAVRYALRHPDRVTGLVFCGAYARGRLRRELTAEQRAQEELMQSVIRVGWGRSDHLFRRVYTMLFVPGGSEEQMRWFDELERVSASPQMAERLRAVWSEIDVSGSLPQLTAPTLVAHARHDAIVPFAEGRLLASGIPGARFLPLDSENHILLSDEPAWPQFLAAMREFVGTGDVRVAEPADELSPRELEVLALVADGLSNEQIAGELVLSVRTVERHLSNVYAKLRISGKAARAAAAARYSGMRT